MQYFPRQALVCLGFATLLLSGCSSFSNLQSSSDGVLALQGMVHGGQQPVNGAKIQLYSVNTTTTGGASTVLIAANVTTNGNGGFSITGDYACANSSTEVYIVATGGNAGAGVNNNISMAAALGSCNTLQNTSFININELTTVAAAYALAPFEGMNYTSIGAPASSILGTVGLPSAFSTANLIISSVTGQQPATIPTGLTIPTAEVNTLADILAACINSDGSSASCTKLSNATGGVPDTLSQAFYIAKNPAVPAVVGLYSIPSPSSPFQPTLAAAPKDFTLALSFTSPDVQKPNGIAIDNLGNAFVTNQSGNSVIALTPLSTSFATGTANSSTGLIGPRGISIDPSGYIWIANTGGANIVEFPPIANLSFNIAGFSTTDSRSIALTGNAADAPVFVANDGSSNAYVVSPGSNSVFSINGSSGKLSATSTNALYSSPVAIAVNGNNLITVGTGAGQLCTLATTLATPTCTTQGSSKAITSVSVSPSNSGSAVGFATTTGTAGAYGPMSGSGPYTGGGLTAPTAIAFDGSSNAFLANSGSLSEFNGANAISPSSGYGTLNAPLGIAVDPSGNVWTTNSGDNTLSIFIGLGAPTITPLSHFSGS